MVTFLLQRKRLVLAVIALSTLVALAGALYNGGAVGPLALKGRSNLQVAAATTQVLVDWPAPSIVQRQLYPQDLDGLGNRAELLGRVMASPAVLERVARRLKVPQDQIGALARTTGNVPRALTEPNSEVRAAEIQWSRSRYRIEVQARPAQPIIDVYSQAPSTAEAEALGTAAVDGLRDYLRDLAARQGFKEAEPVRLRQLGLSRGAVVNSQAPLAIFVITFMTAFAATACLLLGLIFLRVRRMAAPGNAAAHANASATAPMPARPAGRRRVAAVADDWPHTNRLFPWLLAVFVAVLWLIPFNEIQLNVSLPIDLKFDRLVLPFVAGAFLLALVAGSRGGPRLRLTWIHGTVGAFVLIAFLSVVFDARYLNQSLELDQSIKRLPLMISYVSLFVMAAAGIRRTEVRAFLKYMLVLSVICAAGVIWEYRFKYNPFYDLSRKLLPGIFSVGAAESSAVDDIGRRVVRGPAGVPLETVAMLSMALPIALVGLMHAKVWSRRILYCFGACLLLAACFATYRKSALLAPVSVILTLAYFRRRELLKLAPLALVLVVVIHVLSPGALGSTTSQLDANRLGVATVSDRAVDYDAVRPELWTHFALGRGWGSYDRTNYRTLDSEILQRIIEMGVLGLISYLLMGASVIFFARATIAGRDPTWAPLALIGAAAAVSFLTVSTLFDVISFPHATYIFLFVAGLVAVVIEEPRPEEDETDERREARAASLHAVRLRGGDAGPRQGLAARR
jgi:O-antigen ligase/polysaccharide polymerase Wzy-like membrane protein